MTEDALSFVSAGDEEKIITFPRGIPGFEKYTNYVVYHKEENDICAYWLESCEDPAVTFTLVDPCQYGLSYELQLSPDEMDLLRAEDDSNLGVFLILSKREGDGNISPVLNANIIGPIIINPQSRVGLQKVIYRSHIKTTIVQD